MVGVRQQSNFFREDRRLQRVIGDCVGVIISRQNLQKRKSTFIIQSFNELMGSNNEFRTYIFLTNTYYDFFSDWQTEKKKNCFEPIKSLFSFSTAQIEKKMGKTRFVFWWFDPMSLLLIL